MRISIWDLCKYLYKWKLAIIAVTVFALLAATWYVDKKQTYSAKVVIEYLDPCISRGETPDGQKFDSNEIKAPTVILNVLKELGYEHKKVGSVRENIGVVAITPASADNLKEAREKLGEEYSFYPNTFTITYKGDSSYEATRDILSSVISNYFKYYTERYLYLAALNEVDYSLNQKNFDYLEQAEQLQDNVKQTIESLQSYEKDSVSYRSPTTGLTFEDILKDFERIDEYAIPIIFSKIYEAQLSQNKTLLINKYTERMEATEREAANNLYKAESAQTRMEAYVNANRNVHSAYSNPSDDEDINILQDVDWTRDREINTQTMYDNLIVSYANDSIAANNNRIDAEHCRAVIERFTGAVDEGVNYKENEKFVQEKIAEVLEELKVLYEEANTITRDYNAYIPAHHIKKLSGVGYFEDISGSLYQLIAIVLGFGFSCALAIGYEIMRKYAAFQAAHGDEDDDTTKEKSDEDASDLQEA